MNEPDILWEVKFSLVAPEMQCCLVIGPGCILCRVKSAEPYSCCLVWVPYLRCPLAPWPLPHSSVFP